MTGEATTHLNVARAITDAMQQQARRPHRSDDWADIEFLVHPDQRFDGRGASASSLIARRQFAVVHVSRQTRRKYGGGGTGSPVFVDPFKVARRGRSPVRGFAKRPIKHDAPRKTWVGSGKHERHRGTFRETNYRSLLGAGRGHNRANVVNPFFKGRDAAIPVG